jgi:hypothetical protein
VNCHACKSVFRERVQPDKTKLICFHAKADQMGTPCDQVKWCNGKYYEEKR